MDQMLIATRSGVLDDDGERVEIFSGVTRVAPECLEREGYGEFFDVEHRATGVCADQRSLLRVRVEDGHREDDLAERQRAIKRERIREQARDPRHTEAGVDLAVEKPEKKRMTTITDKSPGYEQRDAARRAVDESYDRGELPEPAGQRLMDLIDRDKFSLDSAYIAAIADPAYARAFAKKLTGVNGAEATLEADESAAMLATGRAMAERAMAVGAGETGGFAVPLALDPTILLVNDGAINPIRDLATVSTITATHWQGVSSAGVKAEFAAEATPVEDGAPKLGQPEITPERATIWVPYSFETAMDWPGLAAELGKLFADAKAVKEAEIFATGKGAEHIPQGLITGATKLVETKTKETLAVDDIYALQEALAPRWQPRANWLGTNHLANQIHRFVPAGSTTEAKLMSDDRSEILGKPFREVSTMSAKTTTKKERVMAFGSVADAYRIVDRLGLSVEQVPIVMDEGVPTGQRGLLAWFRVGAKVIIPDAVQVLIVKE